MHFEWVSPKAWMDGGEAHLKNSNTDQIFIAVNKPRICKFKECQFYALMLD